MLGRTICNVEAPNMKEQYFGEDTPHALLASLISRRTLKNGLTVLVKEVYPASVVCLSLWTKVGSFYENDNIAGISHFVEHMLFKGTSSRAVGKIPQQIHALGGYINGFTTYGCTCYWIVLPSRYFRTALEIMADAVKNPLFDPAEIKKESQVIVEEIRMYQDRPESFCFERLMELAYNVHRARRPITGYESVVSALSCDDIVNFYKEYYVPNNMSMVIVGDVRTENAVKAIRSSFGEMEMKGLKADPSPPEPPQEKMRRKKYDGDIGSSHINLGFHISGIFSPDTFACDLLASIIGEGRSSRLHQNLREKKALVTGIGASIMSERDMGMFIIEGALEEKNIEHTRKEIWEEIEKIKENGVTSHELKKAKNMVESGYVFSQETVEGLCKKLGYYEIMGDYTLTDRYIQKLYSVTSDEIKAAASKFLTKKNCSEVIYVPRKKNGR